MARWGRKSDGDGDGWRLFTALVIVVLLSGCAASVKRGDTASRVVKVPPESAQRIVLNMGGPDSVTVHADWEKFKGEWRTALRRHSTLAGIQFEAQEGKPVATGQSGTLLDVWVFDYRYLSQGVRWGFGVMTGNAFVESKIDFRDLVDGKRYGTQTFNTSSTAWEGVFSAMTDKQVDAIAAEIVKEVKGSSGAIAIAAPVPSPPSTTTPASMPVATQTPTAAPTAARVESPAKPQAKTPAPLPGGESSLSAERTAEARACASAPRAVLAAKGPGSETYTIKCDNGDALAVRCEFGNCRALR